MESTTLIQFSQFPELETERMILRQLTVADTKDVFAIRSDKEVMKYIPRPIAQSESDALDVINMMNDFISKNEKYNWAMQLKDSGVVIGIIGYVNIKPEHHRAEIGYSLAKAWHRKGYGTEALKRLMKFGYEKMNLHTIEAIIDAENNASGALLKSVGFRQEAYFREDFLFNGVYRNSIHFGMIYREAKELGICD